MATLSRELRGKLEKTVLKARNEAEQGAEAAIQALGIGEASPPIHLNDDQRELRRRLRAHARQLGDALRTNDTHETTRLRHEVAYEHWHRMLFARFLAENSLLIHPDHNVPLSIDECEELAREKRVDAWDLASRFATKMLPAVFRPEDPVLALTLPVETQNKLIALLRDLPTEVFRADDSLGWVYQFWQKNKKEEINKSGRKIGADELPAVTQLFTEDYMVEFLLHNTLGAWWAGKKLDPRLAQTFESEDECRQHVALPGVEWTYLRFIRDEETNAWKPAAGMFEGWPKKAAEVTVLDPCMGSGHFLVFALPILVAMRMKEEGLSVAEATRKVLEQNLFGLEIDARCAQIAAFNLALAGWRIGGYRMLPEINLACSGLGINAPKEEWIRLGGDDKNLRLTLGQLHELFSNSPILGSLIDPRISPLVKAGLVQVQELYCLLRGALKSEGIDKELAVQALGIAKASEILAGQYTLVATNVPYLGRGNQVNVLQDYCARAHPTAKADLATCFVQRCLAFCHPNGSTALVTPQSWLFRGRYQDIRKLMLLHSCFQLIARLGAGAFETISGHVVQTALCVQSKEDPHTGHKLLGCDASDQTDGRSKAMALLMAELISARQLEQLTNPGHCIVFRVQKGRLLNHYARSVTGLITKDAARFFCKWWEICWPAEDWEFSQSSFEQTADCAGLFDAVRWEKNAGELQRLYKEGVSILAGSLAWKKRGVCVSQTGRLPSTLYHGAFFDDGVAVLIPDDDAHVPALWAFCSSVEFSSGVRALNQALKVPPSILARAPFDLAHWQKVAAERYPHGIPKPFSSDPTQWLFDGHPKDSDSPLQVAAARLLGFKWPRQAGLSFADCPTLGLDGLENFADGDGIVCLASLRGEDSATPRLRKILGVGYQNDLTGRLEQDLLQAVSSSSDTLDEWLQREFFEHHCRLFHNRPFAWHIWDGRKDGFNVFVNYHKLAAPNGEGRRTLETLTYSYLGDWVTRQRDAANRNEEGAEDRLAAALELQDELKKILAGEPPYDIFVRWKPLHEQPIGWEPDINDGVRVNIRPFMMASLSRGKKGAGVLRAKPNIKWEKDRGKEPHREKADYPWFWGWNQRTIDFPGGAEFDGHRWNNCHYTTEMKRRAREAKGL